MIAGTLSQRQQEILGGIAAGLTDKEIARQLGVSYRTVRTHLERIYEATGAKGRSAAVTAWLARAAPGRVEPSQGPALALLEGRLRPQDRELIRQFESLCRAYRRLEELMDVSPALPPPDYGGVGAPADRRDAIRQGELVAAEERRRLRLEDSPIRDLLEVLESQGVSIFVLPLRSPSVSALHTLEPGAAAILVNGSRSGQGLTFSAAHEYAHVLFDRWHGSGLSAERSLLAETGDAGDAAGKLDWLEARADAFAAALLLPRAGLERLLGPLGPDLRPRRFEIADVLYLQRVFGGSLQVVLHRMRNLGWLSHADTLRLAGLRPRRLSQAMGLSWEEPSGAGPVTTRYPARYTYLALKAHTEGRLPLVRLAVTLGRTSAQMQELVAELEAGRRRP
jgi:DNA-binding CsgD family transcriptional regulator/Zn-dependent peptidase ImmA (M78 family)